MSGHISTSEADTRWKRQARQAHARGYGLGLKPDSFLSVSEWADEYRVLSPKAASEPGRWRTTRTPYLREIMDCLSSASPVRRIVFMKGAQIGATESGNNWIGYVIHQAPGPMLAVQPTTDTAKRNSKQRIAPLIEECPALRGLVKESRSRDSGNTVLAKEFPGGVLVMTGANSAVGLRSMPARYLFLDEVDGYPGDLDGEGDPIALAEARSRTFSRRKVFMVSTPTITGRSRIEREYEASDRRRYYVPCPECGEFQTLKFAQLRWPKGKPREARYVCEHCGVLLGDEHKTAMLANGEWRAEAPGEGKAAGFHLSALYSPVGWLSWVEIAESWMAAQGSPELLKSFVNTILGETWTDQGDAPDWERLFERREPYRGVPAEVLFLTAGVDVQKDRIEVSVWGWGRGRQSWLIEHRVIAGDTARAEVWAELTALAGESWRHPSGVDLRLARLAIDSGYATSEVYAWARRQAPGLVLAIKGQDRAAAILGQPKPVDVKADGKRIRRGAKVWPVGVSIVKAETYGWLGLPRPTDGEDWPEGYIHLPDTIDAEFCRQLTAEQLVSRVVKGYRRHEWQKTRERNEALDCRVYARAASVAVGIDRFREHHWRQFEEQLGIRDAGPRRPPPRDTEQTAAPAIAARSSGGRRVRSRGI